MRKEPGETFARLSVSLKFKDEQELQILRAAFATETGERVSLSKAVRMAVTEALKARVA